MAAMLDIITKGSTDRSVTIRIIDASDGTPETGVTFETTGIDLWYRREGATKTSITEATLAGLGSAHADGGFLAIGDGEYRLDVPDAAFATGANYVDIGGTVTGMIVIGGRVRLVDYNLETALPTNFSALGIESDGDLTKVNTLDGHTPQTGDVFAALPTNFADMLIEPATKWTDLVLADGGSTMTVTSASGGFTEDMVGRFMFFNADGVVRTSVVITYVGATEIECYNTAYATELMSGNLTDVIGVIGGRVWVTEQLHRSPDTYGPTLATLLSRIKGTLDTGTHKPQSGDSYARLGSPAGASVSADIAGIHDKTTNLPASPAAVGSEMGLSDGAITAAKIAASALDGKGNWNTTAPPTTGEIAAAILADPANKINVDELGITKAGDGNGNVTATNTGVSHMIEAVPDAVKLAMEAEGGVLAKLDPLIDDGAFTAEAMANAPDSLDAEALRTALGMAEANLDEQIAGIEGGSGAVVNLSIEGTKLTVEND